MRCGSWRAAGRCPGHEIRIVDATGTRSPNARKAGSQFRGPSATRRDTTTIPRRQRALFDGRGSTPATSATSPAGDIFLTGRVQGPHHPGRAQHPPGRTRSGDRRTCRRAQGMRRRLRRARSAQPAPNGWSSWPKRAVTDAAERSRRARHIEATARRRTRSPPDDIVLAPPRSVLKTSSGKIRRAATRDLFVTHRLGKGVDPASRQLVRLALSGLAMRLRSGMACAFRPGLRGVVVGRARHGISGAVAAGCSGAWTEAALGHRARHRAPAAALDGRTCGRDRDMAESWRNTACHQP